MTARDFLHSVVTTIGAGGPPPHSDFAPGMRFGRDSRFELVKELGSGGSSVVWLVHDQRRGRPRAAKFFYSLQGESSELTLSRARSEALVTAHSAHPNVTAVYEMGLWGEHPFLVLEYSDGVTLEQELEQGPLPLTRALAISAGVAAGLEHIHARRVLHLDIKPGNLWLPRAGGVKILDFGLSAISTRGKSGASRRGQILVGTPAYMAPEQWRGETPDERTDLWALGVVLHEMLCGRLPYDDGDESTFREIVTAFRGPAPLRAELGAPESLDAVLSGTLAPEPKQRLGSASELLAALRRAELETEAGVQRAS